MEFSVQNFFEMHLKPSDSPHGRNSRQEYLSRVIAKLRNSFEIHFKKILSRLNYQHCLNGISGKRIYKNHGFFDVKVLELPDVGQNCVLFGYFACLHCLWF